MGYSTNRRGPVYGQLLQHNPWLSRPGDRQVRAAVGDQEGEVMIDIDASSYLLSVSIVSKPSGFQFARSETMPFLRLDRELERHQAEAPTAIAKIDVEGFAVAVLEGFGFRLGQLGAVLVEVTPRSLPRVCHLLEQAGFRMFYIDERLRDLVPLNQAGLPSEGTFDLLAWPQAMPLPELL